MKYTINEIRNDMLESDLKIKQLETEKEAKKAYNPWYPTQDLDAKIAWAKRRHNKLVEAYKRLIHV